MGASGADNHTDTIRPAVARSSRGRSGADGLTAAPRKGRGFLLARIAFEARITTA